MWLWQQSGHNARSRLQQIVVASSCGIHCIALVMIFIVYRGYYAQMHIDVARSTTADTPVLFMPLHKRSKTIPGSKAAKAGSKNGQRATKAASTLQPSRKASSVAKAMADRSADTAPRKRTGKKTASLCTTPAKKQSKKTQSKKPATTLKKVQPAVPKVPVQAILPKKVVPIKKVNPSKAKKSQPKKALPIQAPAVVAQEVAPPVPLEPVVATAAVAVPERRSKKFARAKKALALKAKAREAAQPLPSAKQEVTPVELPQPLVATVEEKNVSSSEGLVHPEPVVQEVVAHEPVEENLIPEPIPLPYQQPDDSALVVDASLHEGSDGMDLALYVGQVEWDAMQVQAEIKHEIERHWRPPAGMARDLVCQIKIVVAWEGAVGSLVLQKRSGVLAYDVHARAAVAAMKFPKATWGKELIISFKQ